MRGRAGAGGSIGKAVRTDPRGSRIGTKSNDFMRLTSRVGTETKRVVCYALAV